MCCVWKAYLHIVSPAIYRCPHKLCMQRHEGRSLLTLPFYEFNCHSRCNIKLISIIKCLNVLFWNMFQLQRDLSLFCVLICWFACGQFHALEKLYPNCSPKWKNNLVLVPDNNNRKSPKCYWCQMLNEIKLRQYNLWSSTPSTFLSWNNAVFHGTRIPTWGPNFFL